MAEQSLDKRLKFEELKIEDMENEQAGYTDAFANEENIFNTSTSNPSTFFQQHHEEDLDQRWAQLLFDMTVRFGKQPDLNALLFLIGLQEMGHGIGTYTKEQKQDLMHIGTCTIFSISGFYEFTGRDADGWPHFRSAKPIPNLPLKEQERMLKWHILEYFS